MGSFGCRGLLLLASCVGSLASLACSDPPTPEPAADPRPAAQVTPAVEREAGAEALQRSVALEQQGKLDEAAAAAAASIAAGGPRDARIQAAKIAILRKRYDDVEAMLRPVLETDPDDADAHYNVGLAAHRSGRYNDARSGYLAALRAKPDYANARYNLALLTWNRNVREEARHHVAKFVETWPQDPRVEELVGLVGAPPPAAAGVAQP